MNLRPIPAIESTLTTERIARFVRSHEGFYVGHDGHGVVIAIDVIDRDGSRWTEYQTVLTMAGAREALGY